MSENKTPEEKFASSLDAKSKKAYIRVFIDEFEATFEIARKAKGMGQEHLKEARARGEHLKRLLRLLGHSKRLPVVGGARESFSNDVPGDIFDGNTDLPLTPEKHYGIIDDQKEKPDA